MADTGYCPDCGTDSSDLVYDSSSGYTECEACGLIFKTEPAGGKAGLGDRGRGNHTRP
jgi:ribosomal protein S27E